MLCTCVYRTLNLLLQGKVTNGKCPACTSTSYSINNKLLIPSELGCRTENFSSRLVRCWRIHFQMEFAQVDLLYKYIRVASPLRIACLYNQLIVFMFSLLYFTGQRLFK